MSMSIEEQLTTQNHRKAVWSTAKDAGRNPDNGTDWLGIIYDGGKQEGAGRSGQESVAPTITPEEETFRRVAIDRARQNNLLKETIIYTAGMVAGKGDLTETGVDNVIAGISTETNKPKIKLMIQLDRDDLATVGTMLKGVIENLDVEAARLQQEADAVKATSPVISLLPESNTHQQETAPSLPPTTVKVGQDADWQTHNTAFLHNVKLMSDNMDYGSFAHAINHLAETMVERHAQTQMHIDETVITHAIADLKDQKIDDSYYPVKIQQDNRLRTAYLDHDALMGVEKCLNDALNHTLGKPTGLGKHVEPSTHPSRPTDRPKLVETTPETNATTLKDYEIELFVNLAVEASSQYNHTSTHVKDEVRRGITIVAEALGKQKAIPDPDGPQTKDSIHQAVQNAITAQKIKSSITPTGSTSHVDIGRTIYKELKKAYHDVSNPPTQPALASSTPIDHFKTKTACLVRKNFGKCPSAMEQPCKDAAIKVSVRLADDFFQQGKPITKPAIHKKVEALIQSGHIQDNLPYSLGNTNTFPLGQRVKDALYNALEELVKAQTQPTILLPAASSTTTNRNGGNSTQPANNNSGSTSPTAFGNAGPQPVSLDNLFEQEAKAIASDPQYAQPVRNALDNTLIEKVQNMGVATITRKEIKKLVEDEHNNGALPGVTRIYGVRNDVKDIKNILEIAVNQARNKHAQTPPSQVSGQGAALTTQQLHQVFLDTMDVYIDDQVAQGIGTSDLKEDAEFMIDEIVDQYGIDITKQGYDASSIKQMIDDYATYGSIDISNVTTLKDAFEDAINHARSFVNPAKGAPINAVTPTP